MECSIRILQDQRSALENQSYSMAAEAFSRGECEQTRTELIDIIRKKFTAEDKAFLLNSRTRGRCETNSPLQNFHRSVGKFKIYKT